MSDPSYSEDTKLYHTVAGRLAAEALAELKRESGIEFPIISFLHSTFTPIYVSLCDSEGKEFARVNFKLKRIISRQFKVEKNFDWNFLTLSGLKKLGWKEEDLVESFGQPLLSNNPHFKTAAPMKLWPEHWLRKGANT